MIQETRHSIPEILARQPLFRGLDSGEIALLAESAREYRVRRNEVLFQKGDQSEGMYIVLMGQVKLFIPSLQGNEKVVHMAGPGATFGEAVMFLDRPYPVTAVATLDSIVLLVLKATLFKALQESPVLSRKMLASLAMRLHELIDDMETCTLRSSIQRVISYLRQQAQRQPASEQVINLDTSKQTVAAQLNLAPETFSRVLGQLSEAGLIEVKGRSIRVLNMAELLNYQS